MGSAFGQECKDELVEMSTFQVILGVVLWAISSLSLVRSLTKPMQRQSTVGLSPATVIITNLQQTFCLANTIIMKWQQLDKCSGNFWGCQPSLIQLYTTISAWALLFAQYICFVWYPTEDLREFRDVRRRNRKILWSQVASCGGLLVLSAVWSSLARCNESPPLRVFGIAMGLVSSLLVLVRFAPQLLITVKTKKSGSVSKTTYAIVGLGGFLQTYFQVFGSKEAWSTWMPVFVSNCVQTAILFLCCFYDWVLPPSRRALESLREGVDGFRRRAVTWQERRNSDELGNLPSGISPSGTSLQAKLNREGVPRAMSAAL